MNLSKLWQIICVGSFICGDAKGQLSGTGTTGVTAGSGRGTGSAGVMTGTGPDTRATSGPYQETITGSASETTVVTDQTPSAKKQSAKVHKRSKKITSKNSTTRNAPATAATATPSPR